VRRVETRGVLLVLVLLLTAVLLVLGGGFLSTKSQEANSARLSFDSVKARNMAYSGLETARVRLLNDASFPPSTLSPLSEVFEVAEVVRNIDDTEEVGRYQLHCDRRWEPEPYQILRVRSIGQVGDENGNPVRYTLIGEFSLKDGERGRLLYLQDLGSF